MQPQRYGPFHYVPINRRPKITWPNGARVALWVIPNIETFPLNEPVPGGTGKAPDIINWAPRDRERDHRALSRSGRDILSGVADGACYYTKCPQRHVRSRL